MLTGTLGEPRPIDVEVWYPADRKVWKDAPPSVYTSRLNGVKLRPNFESDPLSSEVVSHVAREDDAASIDPHGPFPVVVFSHGNTNAPIDYAFTLEHVASHGYVVVGPWHTGNTQDEVRLDFINAAILKQGGVRLSCFDGLPPPCLDASRSIVAPADRAPKSIADRVRDIAAVLDALPEWFGSEVDVTRVAVMGHSRGTLTALAAAGGSTAFNIPVEPRVKAVLGFAIGARILTSPLNLEAVAVPTLLVAGRSDRNSPEVLSKDAFDRLGKSADPGFVPAEKGFVVIKNAEHRSFDSTGCAQMQSAGAITDSDPRAVLDRHTLTGWLINSNGGTTLDFCSHDSFVHPVDITELVATITGFKVVTADTRLEAGDTVHVHVPRAGVDSDEVNRLMSELAVSFLDTVLDDRGRDGVRFSRFLSPKFLVKKEANIAWARIVAGGDEICAPDLAPECAD